MGSRGDSCDNALAETIIGLYKTELIHRRGPWKGLDDVEYATLEWVDWFNHRRLLEPIGHVPPAEFEAASYGGGGPQLRSRTQATEPPVNPERFISWLVRIQNPKREALIAFARRFEHSWGDELADCHRQARLCGNARAIDVPPYSP